MTYPFSHLQRKRIEPAWLCNWIEHQVGSFGQRGEWNSRTHLHSLEKSNLLLLLLKSFNQHGWDNVLYTVCSSLAQFDGNHLAGLQGYDYWSVGCLAYQIQLKRSPHPPGTICFRAPMMMCDLSGCSCSIYCSFLAQHHFFPALPVHFIENEQEGV